MTPLLAAGSLKQARQQHQATLQRLASDADFAKLCQEINDFLQNDAHLVLGEEHNARIYHFLQNDNYPKGLYRVADAAYFRAGIPNWQIVFNVHQFEKLLGQSLSLTAIIHCETAPHLMLISLAPAGSDAAYILEFNANTGQLSDDGFHLPLGKNHIAWRDTNSVWVCPAWDQRQCTTSGYAREVWLWQRGVPFSQAMPIYQAEEQAVRVEACRYLDSLGAPFDLITVWSQFFLPHYFHFDKNQNLHLLNLPKEAEICGYLAGHLLLRLRHDWQRENHRYQQGSLVAVKYSRNQLLHAVALFTPNDHQALETVETSRRYVLIHYLDDVSAALLAWRFDDGQWQSVTAPLLTTHTIELVDQPFGGDIFTFLAEDMLTAATLYQWDARYDELTVIRRQKPAFISEHCTLQRYFARADDGTMIPYFRAGHPDWQVPTVVYVYGGFGMSQLPYYLPLIGKYWLEKGGAWIIANVRGGNEYGPKWHHDAQRAHKKTALNDLIAVVNDVIRHGTQPQHIAIQGGSHGGLMAAAFLCHAPDKAQAIIAEMPLTDMLHYQQWGAGAAWQDEFGTPENPQEKATLTYLSPLEMLKPNLSYPHLLITTDLYDDRVHPMHAWRLYKKAQACGIDVDFYLSESGGHAGRKNAQEEAHLFAVMLRFLQANIAPDWH